MFTIFAICTATAVGFTFRMSWSKVVMKGEIYRVPLFWVMLVFVITIATAPKSAPFVLGVFLVDLIGVIVEDNEKYKKYFSDFLNKFLDLIPLGEVKDDKLH